MDDLQARLDRAITKARDTVLCAPLWPAVDRLSALAGAASWIRGMRGRTSMRKREDT